jgi:RHS repeat-associated protein
MVQSGANPIDFVIDDEGRLGALDRFSQTDVVVLEYDGRSFLCRAEQTTGALARTEPVYDSQGRVMTLRRYASGTAVEEPVHYFYFAGRPVAQLAIDGGGLETWTYLTTDHLGTPVLATDSAAGLVWQGGFEPFGRDWRAGTGGGASENGILLRLPGQWDDGTWEDAASAAGLFYNVHRWYEGGTGRYTRADPLGAIRPGRAALFTANHLYAYAASSPTFFVDPLGLKVVIENPDTAESYDQLKQCFPLFRNIAEHFENDTWTDFGPDRTWTIKDPDFDPPACMVGGRRSEVRTIWVPPGRDCEGKMRCLFHEFYELWLIRAGGFKQFGPAGPAHDQAKAGEEWIPFEKCCPCDADGGQPQ